MILLLLHTLSWGLEWRPCFQRNAEAKCAVLRVPLDEGDARLDVKLLPAIQPAHARNPIYFLAGGPGQSAVALTPHIGPALSKLQQKRDIVFLSQLGTQTDHRFQCQQSNDLGELFMEQDAAYLKTCLPKDSFSPQDYSTKAAIEHLEALRQEMGHEKIILFGVSYGTRLAQAYMRVFPERVESAILDGVLPLDIPLGENIARDSEASLQALIADCNNTENCHRNFPDLATSIQSTIARLQEPIALELKHPRTGRPVQLTMTKEGFISGLRTLLYSADLRSLLPLTLYEIENGDWAPFVAQIASVSQGHQLSMGLYFTIVCSEDFPALSSTAETTRFDVYESLMDGCAIWPSYPVDPKEKEPLRSSIPTLLLSGSFDPVTPHSNAIHLSKTLSEAIVIEYQGQGHNVSFLPCSLSLIDDFLNTGNVEDSSCAHSTTPYFVSPSGPNPMP